MPLSSVLTGERYEIAPENSISMLADYTKMMQQYTDTMTKLNAIDQNSLSAADEAYYLEVMGRITQKLASVA